MRLGGFARPHARALPPLFGLFVVCLGTVVVPFDSAVNVAFPAIIRSLALPIPAIQWVVIAYTLTYAALMLVFGRVGDILGYRRIFLIGSGWSCLAFLACAAAPSFGWLLAGRILQGVGAAMALSCGPALATSLYPESERTRVLGLYTMVFGIGGVLGSVLAGVLVALWDWPAVFWFRAPISLAAFALAWILPRSPRPSREARFDLPGAALLVLAISVLLLALNELRRLATSPPIAASASLAPLPFIGLAALTVCAIVAFVVREHRTAQPLIDLRFFRVGDFALVNAAHVLLNLSGFAVMLLVPFYLDRFGGLSVPESGAILTASNIGLMLSSPVAGRLAGVVPPRRLALAGAAAMLAGQLATGTADTVPTLGVLAAGMLIQGAGLGLFQVAYFDIVTAALPREDRGVAGSLVMMTRTVGVVTGATTLMLAFQGLQAAGAARGLPGSDAFIAGFQGAFHAAAALPALVVLVGLSCGWGRRGSTPTHHTSA
jgi:EmrB/QacA subfamily drug resistance transporter